MAKKKNTQPRGSNLPKKSLVSKRAGIDKLIEANKEKSFSETRSTTSSPSKGAAHVRLPAPPVKAPKPIASVPARVTATKQGLTRIHPTAGAFRSQQPRQGLAGIHPAAGFFQLQESGHGYTRIQPATKPLQLQESRQGYTRIQPAAGALRLQEPTPTYGRYLIRDQRHEETPEVPLVRLPYEPPTPRALRHYKREGYFPFLDLPGELRNRIYEYTIPKGHYAIKWVDNNHKSKSLTYTHARPTHLPAPKLDPGAAQRRRLLDFHHRRVKPTHLSEDDVHPGPAVLLFVCKQMADEAASALYSKSMFHFHGLGALRHFLDNLRPISTKSITRLELNYQYYGHPVKTANQRWKEKHDQLWTTLCWRLTETRSLTHLSLNITLPKSPTRFPSTYDEVRATDIGTRWVMPLWAFKDAGIQRCWARIYCLTKDFAELQEQSLKMRKEIIGDLWDGEDESTRDHFGFEIKGIKELKKGKMLELLEDGRVKVS